MKKILLVTLCVLGLSLTSCMNDVAKEINDKKVAEVSSMFNFATTQSINLTVSYDVPKGYKVMFKVYAENPYTNVPAQ